MNTNETLDKVLKIIKPYVKNEQALKEVSISSRFIEDLKINSARLVDIVLAFEDEFNLSISDEEADKIRTIGNVLDLVNSKTSASVGK